MSSTATNPLVELIISLLQTRLELKGLSVQISHTSSLSELGFDSVDLIDVIMETEERAECVFAPEELEIASELTVAKFANAFTRRNAHS